MASFLGVLAPTRCSLTLSNKAAKSSLLNSCPAPLCKPFTSGRSLGCMPSARRSYTPSAQDDDSTGTKTSDDKVEDLPPWLRKEQLEKLRDPSDSGVPFGVWLLGSVLVAIAAVGSIFELINQNPIFGVIAPGDALYTPILGVFAFTGLPTAGYLFLKGVQGANAMSERMDKVDGR